MPPSTEPATARPTRPQAPPESVEPATDPLADVTLEPRPDWTDKYADDNEGDMRFFDIDALMQAHDLSRAQAIELQNHYRDLSRTGSGTPQTWFAEALQRAQEGRFEDARDLASLTDASFIVVFDLDDTLYDQYYPEDIGRECHDLAIARPDAKTRYVKLAPGWKGAIAKIRELGGSVVLFSANRDDINRENLARWTLDGVPLLEHPDIDGVLTNSHLILQGKRRGEPVVEPSKDLRVVDESLGKVVMVDDNPLRLFQFRNVRVTHKFSAEQWCSAESTDPLRRTLEATLPTVVSEIEESLRYARTQSVDFAIAYLPYTVLGRLAVDSAMGAGMSRKKAIAWVRTHPDAVPERF